MVKGAELDSERKYDITQRTDRKVKKTRELLKGIVSKHTQRAEKEKEKGNNLKALHYYSLASEAAPDNKKLQSLYLEQLAENHSLAKNFYNEAVAYASLGSINEAKKALAQARELAKGDKQLSTRIKEKIAALEKK